MEQVQPPLLLFVYFAPDPTWLLNQKRRKQKARAHILYFKRCCPQLATGLINPQLENKVLPCPRKVPLPFLHIRNGAATSMPLGADALLLAISIHAGDVASMPKLLTQWLKPVRQE